VDGSPRANSEDPLYWKHSRGETGHSREEPMSDKVQTFTDANWESQVLGSPQPVLVDFWAEWCKPCLAMAPDVEAVAEAYDGRLRVGKLNVEENSDVPYKYSITGMPTLLLLKGGRVMDQRVGKMSKEALVRFVEPHL